MKNLIKILIICTSIVACTKPSDVPHSGSVFGGGVLLVNEGNFKAGNGSLSFYSYDSSKVSNDLFSAINGRPLGDVPYSITIKEDKAYIVVNNSGKIEVVDQASLVSRTTISGLISPRIMAIVDDNKAYVSSLYSDSVAIISLASSKIQGYINIRRTSEAITIAGTKAYVSNWAGGKEVMIINTVNDKLIDSVEVGAEPESMVKDKFGMLWVLCNGGWARQNYAELDQINTITGKVAKKLVFSTKEASPTCLKIDGLGQTLYFLDSGVKQMDIGAEIIPPAPLIQESGAHFYKIAVNPINSDIFVTDAADYQQPGNLLLYKNNGLFVSKFKTGIIPGGMCFRLRN